MKKALAFRRLAEAEFIESAAWYDEQQKGLGAEFVAQVGRVLDEIQANPRRYPIVRNDVREAIVARFPFAIYYRDKPDRVVIIAVFHCSRDPAEWQSR